MAILFLNSMQESKICLLNYKVFELWNFNFRRNSFDNMKRERIDKAGGSVVIQRVYSSLGSVAGPRWIRLQGHRGEGPHGSGGLLKAWVLQQVHPPWAGLVPHLHHREALLCSTESTRRTEGTGRCATGVDVTTGQLWNKGGHCSG